MENSDLESNSSSSEVVTIKKRHRKQDSESSTDRLPSGILRKFGATANLMDSPIPVAVKSYLVPAVNACITPVSSTRGATAVDTSHSIFAGGASRTVATESLAGDESDVGRAGYQDDKDLQAIKETCEQMTDVVQRFNASINRVHPLARSYIETMNATLSNLLVTTKSEESLAVGIKQPSVRPRIKYEVRKGAASGDSSDEKGVLLQNHQPRRVRFGRSKVVRRDPESDISSGETSSAPSTERSRSKPHASSSDLLSTADLLQALSRLDNRCVPKPEAFDSQSGQSF